MLGHEKFIQAIGLALDRTAKVIWAYPLFELPTELSDETLKFLLFQKDFSNTTKRNLKL